MNVKGSKCEPKSYVNRNENTLSGYHVDLELSDRSRGVTRELDTPLAIALGVVEPVRSRYMDVIHDMD